MPIVVEAFTYLLENKLWQECVRLIQTSVQLNIEAHAGCEGEYEGEYEGDEGAGEGDGGKRRREGFKCRGRSDCTEDGVRGRRGRENRETAQVGNVIRNWGPRLG